MSKEESLPPNYNKLDKALRSIGYSFDVAVADIVDNSIDANAKNVLVRFLTRKDGYLDLAIWDDGCGMDEKTLREAMRFGSDVSQELERLGKFGLGLKLASLSQAKDLHVVTIKGGNVVGRAWLEHGIAKGFSSTVLDTIECKQLLGLIVPDLSSRRSATVVRWSRLYRVGHQGGSVDENAQKLLRGLKNYLSLAFHRFLSGRARHVKVSIDIFDQEVGMAGIPVYLDPLDPFDYSQTGRSGYPTALLLEGSYEKSISINAHIWPANSAAPGYKLPGGSNARQGFYFYRNNRLIQGGGWNGIREAEPHSSLARMEIDIAPHFDVDVSLDVKKVEIQLPPELVSAIRKAKSSSGIDFKKYLAAADEAYRKRTIMEAELPLIPSFGLPAELTAFLHKELRIKTTNKHRDLKIKWKSMKNTKFFDLDRDSGHLLLNRGFRRRLLHGLPGSAADLPVLKCLLFFVLESALSSERMGPKIRERVNLLNRILIRAVKHERVSE